MAAASIESEPAATAAIPRSASGSTAEKASYRRASRAGSISEVQGMLHGTLWIVVADAGRARIFTVHPKKVRLVRTPIRELLAETAPSRDLATDRPGRHFDSGGEGRHAKDPPTDPHRHEKRRFAQGLARALEEERAKHSFDQLCIVAPPQMLGDLRHELSGQVRRLVTTEISKDLSALPSHDLERRLLPVLDVGGRAPASRRARWGTR